MKISILGLGWLGLPLAKTLIKKGSQVVGSTTSPEKLDQLKPYVDNVYLVKILENEIKGEINELLKNSELLILNIPPGLRKNPESDFVSRMRLLIQAIENSPVKNIIFISSTSVFEDEISFPEITHHSIPNSSSKTSKQLMETEELLKNNTNFNTTILRFAGLIGPDRHPATFLSGKKNLKNPKAPINLIHLDDCIKIIEEIIYQKQWDQVYNAAYPYHPEKEAYYSSICKKMDITAPEYDSNSPSKGKIISTEKVIDDLRYKFSKHPDYSQSF